MNFLRESAAQLMRPVAPEKRKKGPAGADSVFVAASEFYIKGYGAESVFGIKSVF